MLDPIPPFTSENHRLRLVGLVAPLIAVFILIPGYWISKAAGLILGAGFFGQPLLSKVYEGLNLQRFNLTKCAHLLLSAPNRSLC